MTRRLRKWTAEERATAFVMHGSGVSTQDIADALQRTRKSIKSILYNPRRKPPHEHKYYNAPAIERCRTQERLNRNAAEASRELRRAIERAGVRP